jgi:integrase
MGALDQLHDTGGAPKCFRNFMRFLLLSAQRLRMASNMTFDELHGRDWIIGEHRHKTGKVGGEFVLPLTDNLLALVGEGRGFVFSSDGGNTPFSGFSKSKAALDRKLAEIRKASGRKAMPDFVFHDLRRTARSLMSRAGVSSDHAERVLGHAIPGIRGTYDRHEYADEKRAALEKLDAQINRILRPGQAVIRFPKKRSRNSRP